MGLVSLGSGPRAQGPGTQGPLVKFPRLLDFFILHLVKFPTPQARLGDSNTHVWSCLAALFLLLTAVPGQRLLIFKDPAFRWEGLMAEPLN